LVKSNILLIEFLGKDGEAAPRLKDAYVENYETVYHQLLKMMRILFQECRLIHADLSEYNLLYWQETLYMIDVSQSIEHDHPHALEFLRRDIINVNNYFDKQGVQILNIRKVFDFVVDLKIEKGKED
jgi:RIO kinase 1